ncbi:hypothetical protein HMN09_01205100 [Mycena chlorophos]|uniref:RNA ligase/cyclic nucleotide phosphodiesterase n=1 Tax=Mycena chlorophos TaxID=658473 RepID=A0A8H6S6U3_MYCCL|nr:hypothetical protein HMN09_01205100 [Mycena chlorophos]
MRATNPFEAHLQASGGDINRLREIYQTQRSTYNATQKAFLLAPDFVGVIPDPILSRLVAKEPGYNDPRHSLVVWARPSPSVKALVAQIQEKLTAFAPHLWTMPVEELHTTVLEVAFNLTSEEITSIIDRIGPELANRLVELPPTQVALVEPQLSIDSTAIAINFVPASASDSDSGYSYHHLRRDAWAKLNDAGVPVASRYAVPSAHLTIGRFVTTEDHVAPGAVQRWVALLDELNEWLRREYWKPARESGLEWVVGKDHGLILHGGKVWYGLGEHVVAVGESYAS